VGEQTAVDEPLDELCAIFDAETRWNHHEKTLRLSATVFRSWQRPWNANGRSRRPVAASRA
jgi:hypothetical protein